MAMVLLVCRSSRADSSLPESDAHVVLLLDCVGQCSVDDTVFRLDASGRVIYQQWRGSPPRQVPVYMTVRLDVAEVAALWRSLPLEPLRAVADRPHPCEHTDCADSRLTIETATVHKQIVWDPPFPEINGFKEWQLPAALATTEKVLSHFTHPRAQLYRPSRIYVHAEVVGNDWPVGWPRPIDSRNPNICLDGSQLDTALDYAATHPHTFVQQPLPGTANWLREVEKTCAADIEGQALARAAFISGPLLARRLPNRNPSGPWAYWVLYRNGYVVGIEYSPGRIVRLPNVPAPPSLKGREEFLWGKVKAEWHLADSIFWSEDHVAHHVHVGLFHSREYTEPVNPNLPDDVATSIAETIKTLDARVEAAMHSPDARPSPPPPRP